MDKNPLQSELPLSEKPLKFILSHLVLLDGPKSSYLQVVAKKVRGLYFEILKTAFSLPYDAESGFYSTSILQSKQPASFSSCFNQKSSYPLAEKSPAERRSFSNLLSSARFSAQ